MSDLTRRFGEKDLATIVADNNIHENAHRNVDVSNNANDSSRGSFNKNEATATEDSRSGSDDAPVHDVDAGQVQAGVQQIEAVTSVWTTKALVLAYILIWIVYFVDNMQLGAAAALTPFVTSAFQQHSLTPTVGIIAGIIGGVFKLTLAKILDIFGRPQGYLLSIGFATFGLVLMAACNSVEMYAAAQVFYTLGSNAMLYTLGVFVADTSSLKNRGIMTAYVYSPVLITTWLAGPISEGYLEGPGWRWYFGSFSIILPALTLPLFGLFVYNLNKAKAQGAITARQSNRTIWQSFLYYAREFDAVGLLLISGGLALFLLPFNLYTLQGKGWDSPLIICLLVSGIVLIIAFALWERFFAPVTFIPYALLLHRTLLGACVLGATLFVSYFCWNSFFSSFLMVVNNLSVTDASYVTQIYSIGSCLWSIATGLIIRYTGRFKPVALYFGVPLSILGVGLMINFRGATSSVGYIVMCQIFISVAGGTLIICDQIAALATAAHQHIAVVLAVLSMFSEIGGAVGLTVAAAIWQNVFPKKLALYLPPDELPNLAAIYADLNTQLAYPLGTPARAAIQYAYADAQRAMLIAGTAIWALGAAGVLCWRNIDVRAVKQVTGHVV